MFRKESRNSTGANLDLQLIKKASTSLIFHTAVTSGIIWHHPLRPWGKLPLHVYEWCTATVPNGLNNHMLFDLKHGNVYLPHNSRTILGTPHWQPSSSPLPDFLSRWTAMPRRRWVVTFWYTLSKNVIEQICSTDADQPCSWLIRFALQVAIKGGQRCCINLAVAAPGIYATLAMVTCPTLAQLPQALGHGWSVLQRGPALRSFQREGLPNPPARSQARPKPGLGQRNRPAQLNPGHYGHEGWNIALVGPAMQKLSIFVHASVQEEALQCFFRRAPQLQNQQSKLPGLCCGSSCPCGSGQGCTLHIRAAHWQSNASYCQLV